MSNSYDKNYILWSIAKWTFIIGILIAFMGIILEILGAKGYLEIDFSIKKMLSTNIAIASIGIGAFVIIIILPIIITSIKKKANHDNDNEYIRKVKSMGEPSKGRPGEWPSKIFEEVLELLHESGKPSSDIAYALGITDKMAENILENMVKRGAVTKKGNVFYASKH